MHRQLDSKGSVIVRTPYSSRLTAYYLLVAISILATLLMASVAPGYAREPYQTTETPPSTLPLTATSEPLATQSAILTLSTLPSDTVTPTVMATSEPVVTIALDDKVIFFSQLGFVEKRLYGPYDSTSINFGLPATWNLIAGAELHLDFTPVFSSTSGSSTPRSFANTSGSLEVQYNRRLIQVIQLDTFGSQTVTIPIPLDALLSPSDTGRHNLGLFLNSPYSCNPDYKMSVIVHPSSTLILPHEITPPTTNLSLMPRPIFQNTYIPESAVMVVPDSPTTSELEAAMSVSAGFGQMTQRKLMLSTLPMHQLTPEIMAENHLILVGKPDAFPILEAENVPLAAPITEGHFNSPDMQTDDGVLEMAVSPWNPAKVLLIVSGNTDEAVAKAARALSSATVRTTNQKSFALVQDVRLSQPASVNLIDRTFTSLGYNAWTATGAGADSFEYLFYIPPGQVPVDDVYLDLAFRHAAGLNFQQSTLLVTLNGEPAGSVSFNDQTSQNGKVRINISHTQLLSGINRLDVGVNLLPTTECIDPRLSDLWVTVLPESNLHLPLRPAGNLVSPIYDLNQYLTRFAASPTLDNVAIIVPKNDPAAINVAAQVAFELGGQAKLTIAEIKAAYGDEIPTEILQNRDLLIVGKASSLPVIGELSNVLPAPFEPGSNQPIEKNLPVIYRIPPDVSLGYLEFVAPPWSIGRTVLVVAGTTDLGVQWAGTALINPSLRGRLQGQYAVVEDTRVVVDTSNLGLNVEALATTALPDPALQPALPVSSTASRPAWILPAVAISSSLIVLIIMGVVIAGWLGRRQAASKQALQPPMK